MRQRISVDSRGVTLIELVVVLVIIGILGTLVATTYSGIRAKNRNAQREDSINSLQKSLEGYYVEASHYPTLANVNNSAWVAAHLKKISANTLRDPGWSARVRTCTDQGHSSVIANPANNCYAYQVTGADGSACNNSTIPCAQYTLTAKLEGGQKYVKSSLN